MAPSPPLTALVTGSSSGIGLGIARAFLERGDRVVLHGRNAEKLASVAASLGASERLATVSGDIGAKETGEADVDTLGSVALLERVGEVEEIASAVIHLADASFTTGVLLPVDGGFVAGRA